MVHVFCAIHHELNSSGLENVAVWLELIYGRAFEKEEEKQRRCEGLRADRE